MSGSPILRSLQVHVKETCSRCGPVVPSPHAMDGSHQDVILEGRGTPAPTQQSKRAMNGVHDMGGMTCYGRVVREDSEPCFHAPWERRVFGMTMLAIGQIDTLDAFRHAIERLDPTHYLSSTYYEHWLAALEMLAVEKG